MNRERASLGPSTWRGAHARGAAVDWQWTSRCGGLPDGVRSCEAANNLALVLNARGDAPSAIALLEQLLKDNPGFEPAYVTLCRLFVAAGQPEKGLQVLERLLQRNPTHPQGLQLLKQLRGGR